MFGLSLCILTFLLFLFLFSVFLEHRVEGFILFQESTPVFNQIHINEYSTSNFVVKIYDTIYFDPLNGNVVILDGKSDGDDATSASLTEILVLSRVAAAPPASMAASVTTRSAGEGAEMKVSADLVTTTMLNNYNYYMHPNAADRKPTQRFQIAYISCGNDTLLHVYDKDNMVNVGTYLFRRNLDPIKCLVQQGFKYDGKDTVSGGDATKYNRYVREPLYDAAKTNSVFQLTKYVYFDTTCRYLIVKKGGALTVYDGTMGNDGITPLRVYRDVVDVGVVRNTPKTLSATSAFQVQYMNDVDGGNFVLYAPIPSSKKTIIAIFRLHPVMNGNLEMIDSIIFDQDSPNGINGKNDISSQVLGGNACRNTADGGGGDRVADGGGRIAADGGSGDRVAVVDGGGGDRVAVADGAVATNYDENPSYSRNLNSYFNRELNLDRHLTYGSQDSEMRYGAQAQETQGQQQGQGQGQQDALQAGQWQQDTLQKKIEIIQQVLAEAQQYAEREGGMGGFGAGRGVERFISLLASIDAGAYARMSPSEQADFRKVKKLIEDGQAHMDAQAQEGGGGDGDEEDEESGDGEEEDGDGEKDKMAMQKRLCKDAKDPVSCMLSTSVAGYNSAYMLKTKYIPSIPMRQKKKTEAQAKAQSIDPMANLWR